MKVNLLKSNKGQVAVEYILLTVVVMVITMSIMKTVKENMFEDGECPPDSKKLGCVLQNIVKIPDPSMKTFTIKM